MRNDRDNEVLNDSPRLLPVELPPNTNVPGLKSLQLQASSVIFKTDSGGAVVGSTSILLTANLRAITGTPVFTVKSGSATLTPGPGPETRTLQFANMSTDYVVIEVSVEDTSTFKPTGTEPNTVYTDEIMIAKIADGAIGQDGQDGATGPRTATGYLYYQYSKSTAPSKPSASSFNFSSGTFGSLTSNWSPTPPTFQAGNSNKYWYVYYAVREYSYGGGQAVTISNPSQGIGFSGLVTFSGTSLTNGSSSFDYTQIDGGWIKTGKIDADRLNVNKLSALSADLGTVTAGTIQAGDASVSTYLGYSAEGRGGTAGASVTRGVYIIKTGSSSGTLLHSNDRSNNNGYYANYFRTVSGDLAKFYTSGGGSYCVTVEGVGSSTLLNVDGTPSSAGVRTITRNNAVALSAKNVLTGGGVRSDISLATPTHAVYLNTGTIGPFTASHDGLILKTENAEVGDIIVDLAVAAKNGISDCVCFNQVSISAKEKSCVGVLSNRLSLVGRTLAANPGIPVVTLDKDGREVESIGHSPLAWALRDTHDLITFNAVGEGQINVCGQNGNIEIGDLIVTSDMPGKGMKQDDDIVRNYTVAKSREAVTFSSPDEVKQIACIYLCG